MDEQTKYEMISGRLWQDYLDLCESYQNDLPVHEFGYAMIRNVTRMLFDCAPSEMVARETIRVAIEEGLRMSNEDSCNCKNGE
jgi:hypothetical protein